MYRLTASIDGCPFEFMLSTVNEAAEKMDALMDIYRGSAEDMRFEIKDVKESSK